MRAREKLWRKANPEKFKAAKARYDAAHPDQVARWRATRAAKIAAAKAAASCRADALSDEIERSKRATIRRSPEATPIACHPRHSPSRAPSALAATSRATLCRGSHLDTPRPENDLALLY